MIVTQPVFGSPSSVPAANRIIEASYNVSKHSGALHSLSKVGIMVYSGTGAEQWLKYYTHGCDQFCSQWQCNLAACVPKSDMVLGAAGFASQGTIAKLGSDVVSMGLGGFMVWYASVIDSATGKAGLQYGNMDASINSYSAWEAALKKMQAGEVLTVEEEADLQPDADNNTSLQTCGNCNIQYAQDWDAYLASKF